MTDCPCGRSGPFDRCCGPIVAGSAEARTPEELMRSRYVAYTVGAVEHLLRSWAPETRPAAVTIDPMLRWTGLEILDVVGGELLQATGVVEFRAHFVRSGTAGALHERSRFRRQDGSWVYVDGEVTD